MEKTLTFALPSLAHGGAQKVFLELAGYYAKLGFKVNLLLLDRDGELSTRVPEGIDVVDFSVASGRIARRLVQFFRVRRWVRDNDVQSVFSTITGMNIFVLFCFSFNKDVRLVIREANSLENVRSGWLLLLMRLFYWRADKVICTSEYCLTQLSTAKICSKAQLQFIPNPFDLVNIRSLAAEPVDDLPLSRRGSKLIVCVGRLVWQKGIDVLLDAVRLLPSEVNYHLLVIGDGPELSVLEDRVISLGLSEKVSLLGYRANPYPYMASADLFVLSSRWEGYVNTVIEAMVLKLPIVATDCKSGPTDLLRDRLGEALVPIDEPAALAEAIEKALQLSSVPDYSSIVQAHSFDITGQSYLSVL